MKGKWPGKQVYSGPNVPTIHPYPTWTSPLFTHTASVLTIYLYQEVCHTYSSPMLPVFASIALLLRKSQVSAPVLFISRNELSTPYFYGYSPSGVYWYKTKSTERYPFNRDYTKRALKSAFHHFRAAHTLHWTVAAPYLNRPPTVSEPLLKERFRYGSL